MKLSNFLLFVFLFVAPIVHATPPNKAPKSEAIDRITIEKKLGRKLKWTERISLKLVNKRIAKQTRDNGRNKNEKSDGFAIAGFIAGLGTLILFLGMGYGISILLGIAAIILSGVGLGRTQGLKGFRKKGRGLAIAGLVIGIISTLFWLVVLAALSGFIF